MRVELECTLVDCLEGGGYFSVLEVSLVNRAVSNGPKLHKLLPFFDREMITIFETLREEKEIHAFLRTQFLDTGI